MSVSEARRVLRRLELEAYAAVVTAFRAEGQLSIEKKATLTQLSQLLSISVDRHYAEVRRAICDEELTYIADCVSGSESKRSWLPEGKRTGRGNPRLVARNALSAPTQAQVVTALSLSTIRGSGNRPDVTVDETEKKLPSQVQLALKAVIAQHPSSGSRSKAPPPSLTVPPPTSTQRSISIQTDPQQTETTTIGVQADINIDKDSSKSVKENKQESKQEMTIVTDDIGTASSQNIQDSPAVSADIKDSVNVVPEIQESGNDTTVTMPSSTEANVQLTSVTSKPFVHLPLKRPLSPLSRDDLPPAKIAHFSTSMPDLTSVNTSTSEPSTCHADVIIESLSAVNSPVALRSMPLLTPLGISDKSYQFVTTPPTSPVKPVEPVIPVDKSGLESSIGDIVSQPLTTSLSGTVQVSSSNMVSVIQVDDNDLTLSLDKQSEIDSLNIEDLQNDDNKLVDDIISNSLLVSLESDALPCSDSSTSTIIDTTLSETAGLTVNLSVKETENLPIPVVSTTTTLSLDIPVLSPSISSPDVMTNTNIQETDFLLSPLPNLVSTPSSVPLPFLPPAIPITTSPIIFPALINPSVPSPITQPYLFSLPSQPVPTQSSFLFPSLPNSMPLTETTPVLSYQPPVSLFEPVNIKPDTLILSSAQPPTIPAIPTLAELSTNLSPSQSNELHFLSESSLIDSQVSIPGSPQHPRPPPLISPSINTISSPTTPLVSTDVDEKILLETVTTELGVDSIDPSLLNMSDLLSLLQPEDPLDELALTSGQVPSELIVLQESKGLDEEQDIDLNLTEAELLQDLPPELRETVQAILESQKEMDF